MLQKRNGNEVSSPLLTNNPYSGVLAYRKNKFLFFLLEADAVSETPLRGKEHLTISQGSDEGRLVRLDIVPCLGGFQ